MQAEAASDPELPQLTARNLPRAASVQVSLAGASLATAAPVGSYSGAIAGACIGAVAVLAGIGFGMHCWRRLRRASKVQPADPAVEDDMTIKAEPAPHHAHPGLLAATTGPITPTVTMEAAARVAVPPAPSCLAKLS